MKKGMPQKRLPCSPTTAEQRRLLFETWEASGSVLTACQTAQVGRGTFYYWKPRFTERGYDALAEYLRRVPREPKRTPADIALKVVGLHNQNPTWGKHQIAKAMAEANNLIPVISPNTVRRILQDAGLWDKKEKE